MENTSNTAGTDNPAEFVIVACAHCGTKLKLRPAALRVMKDVPCAKCRKKTPVSPEMAGAAAPATAEAAAVTPSDEQPTPTPVPQPAAMPSAAKSAAPAGPSAASGVADTAAARVAPHGAGATTGLADARILALESKLAVLQSRIEDAEEFIDAIRAAAGGKAGR